MVNWEPLIQDGYLVADGYFDEEKCNSLLSELKSLLHTMEPNFTEFTLENYQRAQFVKPHIYEADLHDPLRSWEESIPMLNELFHSDDMKHEIMRNIDFELILGTNGHTVKLQQNMGRKSCFPWHYDNPGPPNRRAITCLLYLNPDWKSGDGGELQLQPFLKELITIEPIMGRCVFFRSDRMLHRTLPTMVERYCLTIWLDGKYMNKGDECYLKTKHLKLEWDALLQLFLTTPLQRVVSRAVYAEEYCISMQESVAFSSDGETMVRSHKAHLESVKKNKVLFKIVKKLIKLRNAI